MSVALAADLGVQVISPFPSVPWTQIFLEQVESTDSFDHTVRPVLRHQLVGKNIGLRRNYVTGGKPGKDGIALLSVWSLTFHHRGLKPWSMGFGFTALFVGVATRSRVAARNQPTTTRPSIYHIKQ